MKISILSLGCKVNQSESSSMEHALRARGESIVDLAEGPDVCIINTCTVTSKSDYQSRQLIRRAARCGARVIVTGCYAELNKESVRSMEGVEGVVINADKDNIIDMITTNTSSFSLDTVGARTRYFLKVQDGCDHSCSYCVIPKARGRSRSRRLDDVIEEAASVAAAGYKEIVLTGIHLGLYGRDLGHGLTELVAELLSNTTGFRIRLSSLEAGEIEEGLLELMTDSRVCRHLHVPLQAGDDRVLFAMNRPYDTRLYAKSIDRILHKLGPIGLGTDIIAGYPTETDREFQNGVEFASSMPFTYMHVFPYSLRPGTAASELKDIVGDPERKRRASVLRDLAAARKAAYIDRQIGSTLEVLVEEGPAVDGYFVGTTENYLRVQIKGAGIARGAMTRTRIVGYSGKLLYGEPEGLS